MSVCRNHDRPSEVVISHAELRALPEYSCTIPTGTTPGKRWRCDVHEGRRHAVFLRQLDLKREGKPPLDPERVVAYLDKWAPEWQIVEYVECECVPDGDIGIAYSWAIDADAGTTYKGDLRV